MTYKKLLLSLIIVLFFYNCGNSEKQQSLESQDRRGREAKDSLDLVAKLKEKKAKDSIVQIEQRIAIGEINFGISKREFDQSRMEFLKKCKLPEMEYYKGLTFFYYKIGEYGFNHFYGLFHNDILYGIRFKGAIVEYDEYNRIMPDQYKVLMNILTEKYGSPTIENDLPEWTDLNKGYFKRVAIWDIGAKRIEVQISCEGVKYYLNLQAYMPTVVEKIEKEKKEKEYKSTKDALEIL